jgi:polysaccharide chain length determinant protein (PEP-CTERM system associated)
VIPGKQYTPEALLEIAWRRKWLIVVPAVVIAASVAVYAKRLPNRYRSETLIRVVPQRIPEKYVGPTVTTKIEDRLQAIKEQTMSRTRLERIIEEFNLYPSARKTGIMEDIVERMRSQDIEVQVVKGDAFRVSFSGDDPVTVMKVTERLASLFIDESLRERETLVEGTDEFLETQLEEARRRLIDNERKAAEYRRRYQSELPNQLTANMQGLHNTEMQLQSLLDSLNRDLDRKVALERIIADATNSEALAASSPPLRIDFRSDAAAGATPPAATATEQLQAAEASLRELELRLKPEHPDVARLKRTIAELRPRAATEAAEHVASPSLPLGPAETAQHKLLTDSKAEQANLERQIAYKTGEEKRLRDVIADYQKRIEAAPARDVELAELTRDYDTIQAGYRDLLSKKQASQLATNLERRQIGEQFKVLDPARRPERPYSPARQRLYLMGLAGGLGFGILLAALAEYLDRSMQSEEDVRIALSLPVLATIPLIRVRRSVGRGRRVAVSNHRSRAHAT